MSHNLPLLNHIHRCGFWGLILGKMPNKRNCNWMFLLSLSLTELSGLLGLCAIKREALALRCLTALVRQPGKPGKVITQPLQCLHTNKLNHTDQTKPHQTDRIKPNAPVRQPGKVTMQPLHTSKLTNWTTLTKPHQSDRTNPFRWLIKQHHWWQFEWMCAHCT